MSTSGRNKRSYVDVLEEAWAQSQLPREPNAPTVISTFAGGGGSSLGYHMAGFRELLAVEWDDNAVQTLRLNFPHLDVYHGDIAKLSVDEVLKRTGLELGQLDVFDGSPPCQGFSTAGKRDMADDRNQLFREYVRLLRGLKPRVFVMENVSGMVKGKMKLIFAEILRELKASGYKVSARLLNAMHYGVPQSRERMIFVGVREDLKIEPSHPVGSSRVVTFSEASENDVGPDLTGIDMERWALIKQGGNFEDLPEKLRTSARFSNAFRKLAMSRPSCTLPKTDGNLTTGAYFHPTIARRITKREKARIGAFPDSYGWIGDQKEQAARIGNSVPPLLMCAIANHIRKQILDKIGSEE